MTYLVLGVASTALQLGIQQSTGEYRSEEYLPLQIWFCVNFAYLLAMVHYLDRSAAAAIERFRPVLQLSSPGESTEHLQYNELRYRLTTLPPRAAAWVAVLGGLILMAIPAAVVRDPASGSPSLARTVLTYGFSATPAGFAAIFLQSFLTQSIASTVIYHTVHQLRLIHHIYVHHTQVNLYRLQPLYAFSIPAALTAGALLFYTYAWFGTAPSQIDQVASRVLAVIFAGVGVITFVSPLWGIHRRLVDEKKRLLQESSMRFEAAAALLHQRVDVRRLIKMDDLNKTLASLEIEQTALRRIPTWPWEPGTLRGVIAALILPIVIWLIQFALGRILE